MIVEEQPDTAPAQRLGQIGHEVALCGAARQNTVERLQWRREEMLGVESREHHETSARVLHLFGKTLHIEILHRLGVRLALAATRVTLRCSLRWSAAHARVGAAGR